MTFDDPATPDELTFAAEDRGRTLQRGRLLRRRRRATEAGVLTLLAAAAAIIPLSLVGSTNPSQRVQTSPTAPTVGGTSLPRVKSPTTTSQPSTKKPTASPTTRSATSIPVPTTSSGPPEPAGTPEAQAQQLLDHVVVPSTANRVPSLPGDVFQAAPQGSSCTGAVDEHRLWTVAESPTAVTSFIRSQQPSWITSSGTGSDTNTKTNTTAYITLDFAHWSAPAGPQSNQVNFVVSALSNTSTGIRADAIIVPPGAQCPSAG